jgi:hypothetical protein
MVAYSFYQCCGSGMFYPGSGSDHFLILDPDPNIFSSGSYVKSGMQTNFFLASYAFGSKVLVLAIVKKIGDPRCGIRKKFMPDNSSRG